MIGASNSDQSVNGFGILGSDKSADLAHWGIPSRSQILDASWNCQDTSQKFLSSIVQKEQKSKSILTRKQKFILWPQMQKMRLRWQLKDALLDFLGQMGQHDHDYLCKLVLAGRDGLTFEKLLQLKRYLQFHDDAFQSLELLVLILELWRVPSFSPAGGCQNHNVNAVYGFADALYLNIMRIIWKLRPEDFLDKLVAFWITEYMFWVVVVGLVTVRGYRHEGINR